MHRRDAERLEPCVHAAAMVGMVMEADSVVSLDDVGEVVDTAWRCDQIHHRSETFLGSIL